MLDSLLHSFSDELTKISEEAKKKSPDRQKIQRQVELWKKLRAGTDTPVRVTGEADFYGRGFYDFKDKFVGVSQKDPHVLAHELGHADIDRNIVGKMIQNKVTSQAYPWTPVAGAVGGALLSRGKKWGALLPIATAAPTLLSEWLATRNGAKRLEGAGATPEEVDMYRSSMSDSASTYHAIIPETLLAGGLGYLAGRVPTS